MRLQCKRNLGKNHIILGKQRISLLTPPPGGLKKGVVLAPQTPLKTFLRGSVYFLCVLIHKNLVMLTPPGGGG
jgi:hypothetical protein